MDRWLLKKNNTDHDYYNISAMEEFVPEPSEFDSEAEPTATTSNSTKNVKIVKRKVTTWKPKLNPSQLNDSFEWIDKKKSIPFCKACNTKVTGGVFHLKRHEKTETHKKLFENAKNSVNIKQFIAEKCNTEQLSVKIAELKLCCYICEKNLPFLLMDTLPLVCRNVFPDSKICDKIKIKRKKATQLTVRILVPFFQNDILTDLKKNVFTLIIDETTDISTKKSLIVIVRYWKNDYVVERVLDLIEVESATAASIFESIKQILDVKSIPYKNIIAFAADNASTMMGDKNGVQAKLKEISPSIYVQGCLCHSLHLCSSAAAKELPSTIEQFARDIYAHFAHSSKRLSELGECQNFANEKPHKLLYLSQTRWLSVRDVVKRILEQWNSLTLFFQRSALEENLPTAKAILNALKNPIFKLYFLFLNYVLDLIIKINLEMQSKCPKFPFLLSRFSNLYKTLIRNFIKMEVINRTEFYKINVNNPNNYLTLNEVYCSAKADALIDLSTQNGTLSEKDIGDFRKSVLKFYIVLCTQIKNRFNFEDKYMQFAENFEPCKIKSKSVIPSIASFINLFPQIENIDIEEINTEWRLLLAQDLKSLSDDIEQFWKEIFEMKNSLGIPMFGNLTNVVTIIFTLAHSSASAERGFSALALNKTKVRNKLNTKTCSAILIVKDEMKNCGGSIEWKPPAKMLNYCTEDLPTTNDENSDNED